MSAKRILVLSGLAALLLLAGCRSAHVTSSIIYIQQQMYDKAIDVLHEGLEYSPDEAEAFFYLGEAHSKKAEEMIRENEYLQAKENYSMAYDYYQKSLEMMPELEERVQESLDYNYVLQSNNAKREYRAGFHEAAEGYFRLAFAALPDSVAPIKNLARMKISMAMENDNDPTYLNEALELLDQVLDVNPGAYELLSDKANVLSRLDRKDEASGIYDQLLADHPEDTGLMIDIANLSQEQGDIERAGDLLVRVMTIYETDDDIENDTEIHGIALQVAGYYGRSDVGRYQEALDLYTKALRLEDVTEETTLRDKLVTHFNYGSHLASLYAAEQDPTLKAEYEQQATAQFQAGVNVGEALVAEFFECQDGIYYLAQCYLMLDDQANFDKYMAQWRSLSTAEE